MTDVLTNGHVKGRGVPPLPTHTFKDSGVTVRLHKLSPITGQEIAQQVQREQAGTKPQPPLVAVDYGQGTITQPNTGDPTYRQMLAAWQAECSRIANDRLFDLACLLAVEVTIGEAERAQIARTKRLLRLTAGIDWQDRDDLTPEENDQLFYMTHVAPGSPDDLKEFYEAITIRSQPTEAAIERHKDSFPGDVSGALDLGL